jgi:hypothetical protein
MAGNTTLYDTDFHAWAQEQAGLLRTGRLDQADIEHIAEEIESMGRSEKRELVSRLTVLLTHLLKWHFQPAFRGSSWRRIIERQRLHLDEHLAETPSLRPLLDDGVRTAYRHARIDAEHETGLLRETFPAACPFAASQILDGEFWPD